MSNQTSAFLTITFLRSIYELDLFLFMIAFTDDEKATS